MPNDDAFLWRDRMERFKGETEAHLSHLDKQMDRLLDPEKGIYPKLNAVYNRLARWGIAILAVLVADLVLMIVKIGVP